VGGRGTSIRGAHRGASTLTLNARVGGQILRANSVAGVTCLARRVVYRV